MKQVKALFPLKLPRAAPPCFDSAEQWKEYRALAVYTGHDGFTFCTDCLPEYKEKMRTEGRCQYPSTLFTKTPMGSVVGHRRRK